MPIPFTLGAEIRLTGACEHCHESVLKIIDSRYALVRYAYPHDAADGGNMYRCRCGDLIEESWMPRPADAPPPSPRLIVNGTEYASAGKTATGETLWAMPGGTRATYSEISRHARLNGWKVQIVNKPKPKTGAA